MAQRTKLEAYQQVRKAFLDGKLGAMAKESHTFGSAFCVYRSENGLNCSVGCLFTAEQLDDICSRGLNSRTIGEVINKIGRRNIEYVTGLSEYDLAYMQSEHDMFFQRNKFIGIDLLGSDFDNFLLGKIKELTVLCI